MMHGAPIAPPGSRRNGIVVNRDDFRSLLVHQDNDSGL
jgi:hypothetical protein